MELNVVRHTSTSKLPEKAHSMSDLGYDIFSNEEISLKSGQYSLISTGISIRSSNINYGFIIKDRSSMAVKGLFTHAGVIDTGYTGEIKVLMCNSNTKPYTIRHGDKIAQLIPTKLIEFEINEVKELNKTCRGKNSFGSTGR
jgi:dUTP pyrophosphatase|tara:strand:+ start:3600 stop:4025 length:426 start_codon:yes stop_codon:yes gene_type:complete